ncbi:hypothetical protein IW136_001092 [Coemansia sp. RSA 678]|nr:hypothetical protein IW136_001092 [Coemansia sp. RSA 678]
MACNLSDSQIAEAYSQVLSNDGIDWMVIGYGSTRDRLSLYASGDGGVTEMALHVPDEVVFCFISFEGSRVLVTHVAEKISGVQRARGLAHQKEVAGFFNHHDVTVNTAKPSELTPTMLRDKTRHLAIKKTGSLGRSNSVQPNKLKHSVWHQRSQGSSRASSPSETSFNGDSADRDLKGIPEVDTRVEFESPTPDTQTEIIQTEDTHQLAPVVEEDNSTPAEAPRNLDPAAPDNATDDTDVTRVRHSQTKSVEIVAAPEVPLQAPLQAPPTPRSFNDAHNDQFPPTEPLVSQAVLRSPTNDEFLQTDSPVIVNFEGSEISPTMADNYVQMDSPPMVPNDKRVSMISNPGTDTFSTAARKPSNAAQRYNSMRERQKSVNHSNRSSVYNGTVQTPSPPEVAVMLDQVKAHRKDVAELAVSAGVMGDKYFKCLRGYTSIQEPAKSFWKRRYFAVADNTLFMYTNECSRTPSDYLPMDNISSPPRDAEDEVLMPHSVAVNFGDGEYYLYFDTASMRQAFEGEVHKAIGAVGP